MNDYSNFINVVIEGKQLPGNEVNRIIKKAINKAAINKLNEQQLKKIADILKDIK